MRYIFSIVREIKYWDENKKLVQFAILSVRSILQLRANLKHTWVTFYWRSTSLFTGFNFLSWNKIILRIIGFIASFELGVAFNHLSKAVDVIRSKSLCLVTTTSSTSSLNARIFFRGGGSTLSTTSFALRPLLLFHLPACSWLFLPLFFRSKYTDQGWWAL